MRITIDITSNKDIPMKTAFINKLQETIDKMLKAGYDWDKKQSKNLKSPEVKYLAHIEEINSNSCIGCLMDLPLAMGIHLDESGYNKYVCTKRKI